jgi:hypothetical protein
MDWLVLCCLCHNCLTSLASVVLAIGWATCAMNRRTGLRFMRKQAGKPPPTKSGGQVAFVMPVKGTHSNSEASWLSQVNRHGYHGKVECIFVVQERSDPAYRLLLQMQADGRLPTDGVRVMVAGLTARTSQKLHNLIYAIERIAESTECVLQLPTRHSAPTEAVPPAPCPLPPFPLPSAPSPRGRSSSLSRLTADAGTCSCSMTT